MINAREAAEISTTCEANIKRIVERLDPHIRAAAERGDRKLIPQDTLYGDPAFQLNERVFVGTELTPVQQKVVSELKALGFQVRVAVRKVRIGGGLGSMDEESTEGTEKYLEISW